MKIIIVSFFAVFFVACASTPQVVTPAVENTSEQKVELDKTSSVEKLKPKLDKDGFKTLSPEWIAYVNETGDQLEVKRYDYNSSSIALSFMAQGQHLLRIGDALETSAKTKSEIIFRDGSRLRIGPRTVIKLDSYSLSSELLHVKLSLLTGSARVNVKKQKFKTNFEIYTPNVALTSSKADLAVRYSSNFKTTYIACFSGNLLAYGLTDSRLRKSYERSMSDNSYMTIETTYDGTKEVYIARDPEKLTGESKKDILESFYSDPEEIDPWEFTGISTSFLRFLTGFEYSNFKELEKSYYSWTAGYVPLIHLFSIVYLEPYIEAAFAKPFSMTFFRTGGRLELQFYKGFYLGFGGGIFWISQDIGLKGRDLGINAGYTFVQKPLDFIDGVRFSYASAKTNGYHQKAFLFSLLVNFYKGRELY